MCAFPIPKRPAPSTPSPDQQSPSTAPAAPSPLSATAPPYPLFRTAAVAAAAAWERTRPLERCSVVRTASPRLRLWGVRRGCVGWWFVVVDGVGAALRLDKVDWDCYCYEG